MVKSQCPAYGKKCHNCRQQNHFTPCCPKLKKAALNVVSRERSGQNDTSQQQGAAPGDHYIYYMSSGQHNPPNAIYAEMNVSDQPTKFLVDSGAACNILPISRLPPGTKLQQTTTLLRTHNGSTLPTEGTAEVHIFNPTTRQEHLVTFEMVKMGHMPVLGARAVQELKLLTINEENFRCVHAVQTLPTTKAEVLNC